ncbi:glycosyltransferase [Patescibacteria group bacterium]|nr:glycosyltransferase [Patescibacteria group bacterium]MBU1721850.1 glycosyltransferase [Patescibacteria group bacterium]MBU1901655.1 glycosyltransferase [Patescibacteria group bacterium]
MKILLVNKYWYIRGGAERVLFDTKELLENAGHEVFIFGMHHPKNTIDEKQFSAYIDYASLGFFGKISAGWKSIYNKEAKKKFAAYIEQVQPDVVHVHNIYHQLSFSLLDVVKEKCIPSVMTLHDYKMISPNYRLFHHGAIEKQMIGKKYYRCLLGNCMESLGQSFFAMIEAYVRVWKKWHQVIDAYIAPSQFMKDISVTGGLSEENINVIPNAVDIGELATKEKKYVAYVGRLSKEKGIHVLLAAAKETPDISYIIVGTGPEEKKIKAYIQKEQLENVSLVGWQTGKQLEQYIDKASLLVVPSIWYENCPLSILEAHAKGKIVIGADIGGISELVSKELLCEAGDSHALAEKVKLWYSRSSKEKQIMQNSIYKETKKKYNKENYLHALEVVYKRVCIKK